jgi:ABC-2 type transport system ATP-binding protein
MQAALAIDHLWKSFGGIAVVKDLTLQIAPGEIFGLLGPNGAGKSTTINMAVGVTHIDAGTIRIFGYDNRKDYRITRRLVGVMHQEIVTDNFFTIDGALKIHSGYYGVPADDVWRRTLVEQLGLGPHLHKPMNKLSGGLKRRFMVAKALIHRPSLLILDEPTAGVDVELRHSLWEFVREINREGTTVLLTTHYLEEAQQMCDRIGIMHHGQLVALATTPDLLARLRSRRMVLQLEHPLAKIPEELEEFGAQLEAGGSLLTLIIPMERPAGEVLRTLCRIGLSIRELETQQAGLEEVFMKITGMKLPNGRKGSNG